MAVTAGGAQLTEGHRLAQARLGAQTVRLLRSTWPLLDPTDLDATISRWLRVAVPLVTRQRRLSAVLAGQYLQAFRSLEVGVGGYTPTLDDFADIRAVTTSLTVTGPVQVKQQMRRLVPLVRALELAEAGAARSGMRHALNGGRNTILRSVQEDRLALGWIRTTSGDPCSFCALLASRGPVFKEGATFAASDARFVGDGDAKVHDSCLCSIEPVFRADTTWPGRAREWADLYDDAARGESDPLNAFRRAYESGSVPVAPGG